MFNVTALGEMLIDFTEQGKSSSGQNLFAQNAGGAPANVVACISKLGAKTAFIGKAGLDMHGKFLKQTLIDNGIYADGFVLDKNYFTTLAFVAIAPDGEREFSFARQHGADKMLSKKDVSLDIIKNSKVLHVGSVSMTDGPSADATLYAVKMAKKLGVTVSYDPNYRASLWSNEATAIKKMRSILKYADIVKISDEETVLLTGESDYVKAGEVLLNNGVSLAIITLGKDGAYVVNKEGGAVVSGFKAKAVDATGAGDSFFGGFLYKLTEIDKTPNKLSLNEACDFAKFGNAVASLCVEGYGAIPSLPTMDKVLERLKQI